MRTDPNDTIVALSSAPGPGARAVVRLSGAAAARVVARFFRSDGGLGVEARHFYQGQLALPEVRAPLPADVYVWPPPHTYTGQLLVEIHTVSCPPLVELLIGQCLSAGARAAAPGEFTQ